MVRRNELLVSRRRVVCAGTSLHYVGEEQVNILWAASTYTYTHTDTQQLQAHVEQNRHIKWINTGKHTVSDLEKVRFPPFFFSCCENYTSVSRLQEVTQRINLCVCVCVCVGNESCPQLHIGKSLGKYQAFTSTHSSLRLYVPSAEMCRDTI